MRKLLLGFASVSVLASPALALTPTQKAALITSTLPKTCPRGLAYVAVGDGCLGANPNSIFKVTYPAPNGHGEDFSVYARQSGQTWIAPHPWPWNAPGIDYPVGYDKRTKFLDWEVIDAVTDTSASVTQIGGVWTLTNPDPVTNCGTSSAGTTICGELWPGQVVTWSGNSGTTVTIAKQLTATTWALNNPSGLSITGKAITATWPGALGCSIVPSTGVSSGVTAAQVQCESVPPSGVWDLSGFDFSLHGCVSIRANQSSGFYTLKIWNSNFANGPNCDYPNLSYVTIAVSQVAMDIRYSMFNGNLMGNNRFITNDGRGTSSHVITSYLEYNAFINANQDIGALQANDENWIARYNYGENFNMANGIPEGDHGAWFNTAPSVGGDPVNLLQYSFNTSVEGSSAPVGYGSSVFTVNGQSTSNAVYNTVQIDHNVSVINLAGGKGGGNSYEDSLMFYNGVIVHNGYVYDNYTDPVGASGCLGNNGDAEPITGFVDDGTGAAASNFTAYIDNNSTPGTYSGVAGNYLTVTSPPTSGSLVVGQVIYTLDAPVYNVMVGLDQKSPTNNSPETITGVADSGTGYTTYTLTGASVAIPSLSNWQAYKSSGNAGNVFTVTGTNGSIYEYSEIGNAYGSVDLGAITWGGTCGPASCTGDGGTGTYTLSHSSSAASSFNTTLAGEWETSEGPVWNSIMTGNRNLLNGETIIATGAHYIGPGYVCSGTNGSSL